MYRICSTPKYLMDLFSYILFIVPFAVPLPRYRAKVEIEFQLKAQLKVKIKVQLKVLGKCRGEGTPKSTAKVQVIIRKIVQYWSKTIFLFFVKKFEESHALPKSPFLVFLKI